MKKLMLALVTGLFVAGSMAMTGPAFGQGRLNILVMAHRRPPHQHARWPVLGKL